MELLIEVEHFSYRGGDVFHRWGIKASNRPLDKESIIYGPKLIDQQV